MCLVFVRCCDFFVIFRFFHDFRKSFEKLIGIMKSPTGIQTFKTLRRQKLELSRSEPFLCVKIRKFVLIYL